jgi:hypothetical protein
MYHFSRAIYRDLAPYVLEEKRPTQRESNRTMLLHECESAIERLMTDRRYFARPSRTLFNNVRPYFSIADLPLVYVTIDRNIQLALRFLAAMPYYAQEASGIPRHCHAMTRKGQPCQRQPLAASDYCPSHQHLIETFEDLELADVAA